MSKVVARFEKVSYDEFKKSWLKIYSSIGYSDEEIKDIYDNIRLPERSTKRSSGYDFFSPVNLSIIIVKGVSTIIPTGIRCVFLEDGYDLILCPRSGMGFKNRVHLDNTIGVIDNDYFESENEGHIMVKLSCDPRNEDYVTINPGDKFVQGIIREYFLAENDDEVEKQNRDGGFGSTGE